MTTILYGEGLYPDDSVEREVFGAGARIRQFDVPDLAALDPAVCADVEGLMLFRHFCTAADIARFPRLRVIVRMGVGYDRIDRVAASVRGIVVCNTPDYGTTEVADHAIALTLALRRGLLLHHAAQRATPPADWVPIESPLVRRLGGQTFGVFGLGRIGTAAALRAKALGFRVLFHDPYRPSGTERALGIERADTVPALLEQSDVLSLHAPLTRETHGMIDAAALARLPAGSVVVNTARGPILDLDALEAALRSGHVAGAGLDVIAVEPPTEPLPGLLRAYRAHEAWLEGRVIVTPHSAFHSPEAWADIRRKSAETMAAALAGRARNIISPDDL